MSRTLTKTVIDKEAFFAEFDERYSSQDLPGSVIYERIEKELLRQHKLRAFDTYDSFRSAKSKHIRKILRKK